MDPAQAFNLEAEKNFLSSLATISCLNVAEAKLLLDQLGIAATDFVGPEHRHIFEAARGMLTKNLPIDALSVKAHSQLPQVEACGGWKFLVSVLNSDSFASAGASHVRSFGIQLKDLSLKRNVLSILSDAQQQFFSSESTLSVITKLTSQLSSLRIEGTTSIRSFRDVLAGIVDRVQAIQDLNGAPILSTGIKRLDEAMGGWQPTLTLVAALPGVGKSAFMATSIDALAQAGVNVGVISLEDDPSWLGYRILAHQAGVEQGALRFRKMSDKEFARTGEGYKKLYSYSGNIFMADGSEIGMQIDSIVHTCHDMIINCGCKIIFLDHLGEIKYERRQTDRYDLEVSHHLSLLRGIANKFSVPVIASLHIRRRDGLGLGNKPTASDCANSSGAERRARVLLALSRPAGEGGDTISIHILKNTNGLAGQTINVAFIGDAAMLARD